MTEDRRMFIDGEWTAASSGEWLESTDPANGELNARVASGTEADVDAAVDAARRALDGPWGGTDGAARGRLLHAVADAIRERMDDIVETEVRDQGKPYREARADVHYAANTFEYYAGAADKIEGKQIPVPGDRINYTVREPLGVTAHIVPWNYPFQLATRSIAPALAAGNTVVAKPASDTSLSLLLLAEILDGMEDVPDGAFNVVTGRGSVVGSALAGHRDVDEVTLTGGPETGVQVMKAAAEHVTPVTLELGSKGPNIVFPDADAEAAMKGVAHGIFLNCGQMCWAGSRLLVHEDQEDAFLESLTNYVRKWPLGHGLDEGTRLGPLASAAHRDTVEGYIETGKDEGATLVTGGERPDDPDLADGNFLQPTVFKDVTQGMTIANEEIFGPVLSVLTFEDEEEALEIANAPDVGLYSGVWTSNLQRAHRVAGELEYGMVSVNEYPVTFPQTPFTGWKRSGIGSEQGLDALHHYTRVKNVNVNLR